MGEDGDEGGGMIYRLTLDLRVESPTETLALREAARRILRMTEAIPDGERRRLFMPGDSVTVRPVMQSIVLPFGLR